MAKELKTVYIKIPVTTIDAIERIADAEHRTTSAQVVMILELWLHKNSKSLLKLGKAGADPNAG
jgi:hypothetical protein